MATGPNQILIKRSDTAGVQPSGLSFGEPAINTADGRLFFNQQTNGTPSGDLWEFRGITNERFVTSVNGSTGDVTVTDLVGGATDIIGISNGAGFEGVTAVAFGSANDGVTFGIAVSGQTASITLDLSGFEPSTVFRRKYNYTELTGVLNTPNANANGDLEYNQDTGVMSIYKFDKDGNDFRTVLAPIPGISASGRVLLTFGDGAQSKAYEFNTFSSTTNYDNTNLDLLIDSISTGTTGGSGKVVGVEIEMENSERFARSLRLPGNGGTTFDTVVTSFAGFTGAVAAGVTTNQVLFHDGTGISGSNDFLWEANVNHPHAEVDIEGKLLKAIKADEALAALDPVYITGNVGASDRVTVAKADASDSAKMPAAGIVTHSFSTNDEGYMVVTGLVREANTSGYSANDTAYVAVGGGITAARPSGANDLIQNLGRVGRVHASTGTLLVLGAGRANDTPNLIHARAGISADAGITFPDGTHQASAATSGISELNGSTAAGITMAQGFRYKVSAVAASPSSPSAGEIAIKDFAGAGLIPSGFKIHKNPHNSIIDLSLDSSDNDGHFTKLADAGGIVTIINEKTGKSAYFVNSDGSNFTSSSNILEYSSNANSYDATSALASVGDFVIVKLDFYTDPGVKSIGGTAFQNKGDLLLGKGLTAENAGGGQGRLRLEQETFGFILDGNGSPLGTGDKLDALRQIPYDMTVDLTSAFVAAGVSGTDKTIAFAIKKTSALSGSISGTRLVLGNTASANQTGFTFDGIGGGIHFRELASASSVSGATVDQNEWIFPEITGNSGDINKIQIFMKLKPQD